jgi:hypothetical protein
VFPDLRIVALSNARSELAKAVTAGATAGRLSSMPPDELAALVARLARAGIY